MKTTGVTTNKVKIQGWGVFFVSYFFILQAETRGHWRRLCSSEPKLSDKTVSGTAKRYECCRLKLFL